MSAHTPGVKTFTGNIAEMECGCIYTQAVRRGEHRMDWCPLHAAAPRMLKALQDVVTCIHPDGQLCWCPPTGQKASISDVHESYCLETRAILRDVEGEGNG